MKIHMMCVMCVVASGLSACVGGGEENEREDQDLRDAGFDKGTPPRDFEQPVLCDGTMTPYSIISIFEADGETPYCGDFTIKFAGIDYKNEQSETIYTRDDCTLEASNDPDMSDSNLMCSCFAPYNDFSYEITVPGQGTVTGMGETPNECSGVLHVKKSLPFNE